MSVEHSNLKEMEAVTFLYNLMVQIVATIEVTTFAQHSKKITQEN